jgi:O-antigen chain-terminating methyltransferase
MLQRNNPAIDVETLSARVETAVASLSRAGRGGSRRIGDRTVERRAEAPSGLPASRRRRLAQAVVRVPGLAGIAQWIWAVLRLSKRFTYLFGALERINTQFDSGDARMRQLESRLDRLDGLLQARVAGLDGRAEQLESAVERLSVTVTGLTRTEAALRQEIMFQQRRLARAVEASGPAAADAPRGLPGNSLDQLYASFEDVFRGERADIRKRVVVHLDRLMLAGAGRRETPIVDIGCGRGEWLELLREAGLAAYGIDSNSVMVERTRALGLDAREEDLLAHLRSRPDACRSAVTAFHVVEHLPFEVLVAFLDEALRVLTPGGLLLLETPNPENMRVGATTFYYDPTHRNPLPPEPLQFVVGQRGFVDVEIMRLHPAGAHERLVGSGPDVERLNALLFGPRDYAILARKP